MAGDNVNPEMDLLNFAPRVVAPTLMLNGRYDFVYPPGGSQLPLFGLLGTPEGQKRHVQFDSGHMPPIQDVMREILDWLARNLGPVEIRQCAFGARRPPPREERKSGADSRSRVP